MATPNDHKARAAQLSGETPASSPGHRNAPARVADETVREQLEEGARLVELSERRVQLGERGEHTGAAGELLSLGNGGYLAGLLAALLLASCGGHRIQAETATLCRSGAVEPSALRAHVDTLTTGFAPRDFDHPENLDRAAAFLAQALRSTGVAVSEQTYRVGERQYRNVIGEIGPDTGERIVVGAHYDTAGDQPGADDNASGVAGLLELARLLAASPPPLRVELAAYTLEEPPSFGTERMGSAVHARALADRGAPVRLMMSLEMIGVFSDAKGSQRYPPVVGWFHPSTANFIAVVGKWGQGGAVREVAAALRASSKLPVETLAAPTFVTGVDFSDHRSFWAHGYDAVMITDTSFYRNARYHTSEDRADTLDYARMAEAVKGIHCAVQAVARR